MRIKDHCTHMKYDSHVMWWHTNPRERCPGGRWRPVTDFVNWDAALAEAQVVGMVDVDLRHRVERIINAAFGVVPE